MRLLPLLFLLLLSACVAGTGEAGRSACGLTARSDLPFAPAGPFALVQSQVHGREVLLVLDTGAGGTVLSDAAARRAGVPPDPERLVRARGIGGTATYPTGRIARLQLGSVAVDNAVVTLMPQVPLADGNIGMDILGDADLDIDMAAGRIALYRGSLCPDTGPPWREPATELRTEARMPPRLPATARPRMLLVEMELDGQPALALLDTGAAHSVVTGSFAARLGVDDAALQQQPPVSMAGLSLERGRGHLWRFREARIGGEVFREPRMVVAEMADPGFDVLLGMDYLGSRRIWISYHARRVFVARR